jgi:hypothetical protein
MILLKTKLAHCGVLAWDATEPMAAPLAIPRTYEKQSAFKSFKGTTDDLRYKD